jgi:hypothetical protein
MEHTQKNQQEVIRLLGNVVWDYNISIEDLQDLIEGRKERAGHYTRERFFLKLLESYSWFTILKILRPEQILDLLTRSNLNKLKRKSLVSKYEYIQKRLQQTLPASN